MFFMLPLINDELIDSRYLYFSDNLFTLGELIFYEKCNARERSLKLLKLNPREKSQKASEKLKWCKK